MRVTIDTKHDSLEEIKKVVALLSEMIHKQSSSNSSGNSMLDFNLPAGNSNSADASSGGMMNMFDLPDSGISSNKQEAVSSSEAPFGSLAGIFNTANGGATGSGKRSEEKDEKEAYSYSGEAKMEVY